ncbi:glutaredoxin domain-containing protein [Eubacterium aggregans]|uniref:glutaredoxin domain-containing protein n=1 Tax=Eubacterium aggregans TaxID=81409 RepID=UPI0023F47FF8|nr:glutaredoxin domain-containing protein [Eubacterium aggregans]MDD4691086.1 glutaredoxin domain-containing protein [Eubacterium aggregans]
MQNRKITLYTWPHCPFCISAKRLLKARGLQYEDHNILGKSAEKEDLIAKTGQTTVPYIFFDDELIGGYSELAALDDSGKLAEIFGK